MTPGGNNLLPLFEVAEKTNTVQLIKMENATGTIIVFFQNAARYAQCALKWLDVPDGQYYFSGNDEDTKDKINALIQRYTASPTAWNTNYHIGDSFAVDNENYRYRLCIQNNNTSAVTKQVEFHNLMLNAGTEPLPFEPYYPLCVYDRTQADVDRVLELNQKYLARTITDEEKVEWAGGLKGALNISDLNRIEENTALLASLLAVTAQTKTWNYNDIPRASDYLRIRNNVQSVRDAWAALSDTPDTPTQPLVTYQKWNDIERILHDVNYVYERTMNSYYYCDTEIYAGEGAGIL